MDNETNTASKAEHLSIVPVEFSKSHAASYIDSMIERIDGADNILKCTVCGKELKGMKAKTILMQHKETHITRLSYPCDQCDTVCRTSNALNVHVFRKH